MEFTRPARSGSSSSVLPYHHRLRNGLKVCLSTIVDPVSPQVLRGSKVDFVTELTGSSFRVVNNPQVFGSMWMWRQLGGEELTSLFLFLSHALIERPCVSCS